MTLSCEIEHLRSFNGLPEGLKFVLSLDGVQSARVLRYAIWPGEFTIPPGVSREEEARLVADYQAKWREESVAWSEFEAAVLLRSKYPIGLPVCVRHVEHLQCCPQGRVQPVTP
jgi:hypothetical protein